MSVRDEDDKSTVVLDLVALRKQKQKQEEDLANIASELEFNVGNDEDALFPGVDDDFGASAVETFEAPKPKALPKKAEAAVSKTKTPVVLFDYKSDFFQKSLSVFPKQYEYKVTKSLTDLNACLKSKNYKLVVFNYDGDAKAVNQLCAQIKLKYPTIKTIIMAKAISPQKAQMHAKTKSGASGYYQLPLETAKIEKEFQKIDAQIKKAA
jgi:hypothetical protein